MTKKEQLFSMSGKAFVRITEGACLEDVPSMQKIYKAMALANNLTYEEDDSHIAVGGRFWMKPLFKRRERCKVVFTPTSYKVFIGKHTLHGGKHKDVFITPSGFFTIAYDGTKIEYIMEDKHE
jgi:hypothetical protein